MEHRILSVQRDSNARPGTLTYVGIKRPQQRLDVSPNYVTENRIVEDGGERLTVPTVHVQ